MGYFQSKNYVHLQAEETTIKVALDGLFETLNSPDDDDSDPVAHS
jgi:hypothetical protein